MAQCIVNTARTILCGKGALPFLAFQDTFFCVPLEDANDDPPVFAFDINDRPTIRRLDDRFSGFVRRRYQRFSDA